MRRLVGVKAYGYDWANVHGLSMADAADRLVRHGVDWVLVQNDLDPLPGSAVDQRPPAHGYDDRAFRAHLREHGRTVYESTAVFFAPEAFDADAALRPVGSDGRVFSPVGWYVGICPSDPAYLARKAERIARVVERLDPDGVFISFIRFPGFWELWMPETTREDIAEYCFLPALPGAVRGGDRDRPAARQHGAARRGAHPRVAARVDGLEMLAGGPGGAVPARGGHGGQAERANPAQWFRPGHRRLRQRRRGGARAALRRPQPRSWTTTS